MALDKHLFLKKPQETDLVEHTPFYRYFLEAWRVLIISRMPDTAAGAWLLEEPLFTNPNLQSSASQCSCLRTAGCLKLGHLVGFDPPRSSWD